MVFLKQLFNPEPRQPAATAEINDFTGRFTTATIAGIDRDDPGRYPARLYRTMAFHFGAIDWLCRKFGYSETETPGIFVAFVDRYSSLPVTETGSIAERRQGFRRNTEERRYPEAGINVFRRWQNTMAVVHRCYRAKC